MLVFTYPGRKVEFSMQKKLVLCGILLETILEHLDEILLLRWMKYYSFFALKIFEKTFLLLSFLYFTIFYHYCNC